MHNYFQVENLDQNAAELLMAAERYSLPKLKVMAENSLCKNLKVTISYSVAPQRSTVKKLFIIESLIG